MDAATNQTGGTSDTGYDKRDSNKEAGLEMTRRNLRSTPTRRSLLLGTAGAAGVLVTAGLPVTTAFAATAAESYVQTTGERILAIANSGSSSSNKKSQFLSLLNSRAATWEIAHHVLGSHSGWWESLGGTSAKNTYAGLVMKYIAKAFITYLDEIAGESFEVTRSSGETVTSRVKFADGRSPITVGWRLYSVSGSYKVFNVTVSGVSMIGTARTNFSSIIRNNGIGNISDMQAYLRNNT